MKLAQGVAVAAFLATSSVGYADQISHKIFSFAENKASTDCYEKIAEVGARFAAAAGVPLSSTDCVVDRLDDRLLQGVITYEADERVEVTRYIQYGNYSTEETYLYKSEEDCREDLSTQVNLFVNQTGLRPHYESCIAKIDSMYKKWRLQIEAVGESATEHFMLGVDLWGQPVNGYEWYWRSLAQALSNRNLSLSKIALARSVFSYRTTVGYYGQDKLYIYNSDEIRFDTIADCLIAEEHARSRFGRLQNSPLLVFCGADRNGLLGVRLNLYTLEHNLAQTAEFRHQSLPGFFETFAACMLEHPRQWQRLQQQGAPVIDLFCGKRPDERYTLQGYFKN